MASNRTNTKTEDYMKTDYEKEIAILKKENRMLRDKYRSMYEFCLSIMKLAQSINRLGELSK